MRAIDIIPVDPQTQTRLTDSDPKQQKGIRAQLRKDLSLSMKDSVDLVERLAVGTASPTSWTEAGDAVAGRAPDLTSQVREIATSDRFEAMRSLRSAIAGLGINEAKQLLEALDNVSHHT